MYYKILWENNSYRFLSKEKTFCLSYFLLVNIYSVDVSIDDSNNSLEKENILWLLLSYCCMTPTYKSYPWSKHFVQSMDGIKLFNIVLSTAFIGYFFLYLILDYFSRILSILWLNLRKYMHINIRSRFKCIKLTDGDHIFPRDSLLNDVLIFNLFLCEKKNPKDRSFSMPRIIFKGRG